MGEAAASSGADAAEVEHVEHGSRVEDVGTHGQEIAEGGQHGHPILQGVRDGSYHGVGWDGTW
ncbi:MAG: hypothetical protein BWY17_05252 [Deltaproteobacteria bacterium ADurb.Bin207]|jgi:hypothetical protein|nr:MAG: hypothetical protein BWY17_05252 [Deltaproteobacteria bacterium ADurb.Bin207]